MRPLVLAQAAAIALTGFVGPAGSADVPPAGNVRANAGMLLATGGALGELRFQCSACHGINGLGDASGAFPRLAGQRAWYLFHELHAFASGARASAVMGPIALELSDDQMLNLAAYYGSLSDAEPVPVVTADQSAINQGRSIVGGSGNAPACSACHGADGEGGTVYPALAGQYPGYIEEQMLLFKSGGRTDDPLDVMRPIAAALSDEEIHAASLYLATLPPMIGATSPRPAAPGDAPLPLPYRVGATRHPQPRLGSDVFQ